MTIGVVGCLLVTFLVFSLLFGSWGRDDRPPTTTIAEAQEEAAAVKIEAVKKAVILRQAYFVARTEMQREMTEAAQEARKSPPRGGRRP